jgi:hypothetical protein
MSVEGREETSGAPQMNALPSADLSTGIAIAWGANAPAAVSASAPR